MPSYSLNNKRPFFDIEAQTACLQVRQTNIGHDGQYVIFLWPSKDGRCTDFFPNWEECQRSDRAVGLAKALKHLGLDVTGQQVDEAVGLVFRRGYQPKMDRRFVHCFCTLEGWE